MTKKRDYAVDKAKGRLPVDPVEPEPVQETPAPPAPAPVTESINYKEKLREAEIRIEVLEQTLSSLIGKLTG